MDVSPLFHWLIGAVGLAATAVFVVAYRYAARQTGAHSLEPVPRAEVVAGTGDESRQQVYRTLRILQAGAIAFGITAIFFMVLCLIACIALLAVGT